MQPVVKLLCPLVIITIEFRRTAHDINAHGILFPCFLCYVSGLSGLVVARLTGVTVHRIKAHWLHYHYSHHDAYGLHTPGRFSLLSSE